ncbi:hypothetical protein ACSBR1_031817 [Camellia fascicularis]
MGTEVLRPQDCLIERVRVAPAVFHHRRKNFVVPGNQYPNPNPKSTSRKPAVRPEQRKRSEPLISNRSASLDDVKKSHNHLVTGQVTILRRGESLDSKIGDHHRGPATKSSGDDLVLYGSKRLGPDPEMVRKEIRIGELRSVSLSPPVFSSGDREYAGSAFSMSPSPRSLPLPSFFNKKQVSKVAVDGDSATRDLRRLLRLD